VFKFFSNMTKFYSSNKSIYYFFKVNTKISTWSQEIWSKNVIFKCKNYVPHLLFRVQIVFFSNSFFRHLNKALILFFLYRFMMVVRKNVLEYIIKLVVVENKVRLKKCLNFFQIWQSSIVQINLSSDNQCDDITIHFYGASS
jgi:hypothetical protein